MKVTIKLSRIKKIHVSVLYIKFIGRSVCNLNHFKTHIENEHLMQVLWNCPRVNGTRPSWRIVNCGPGNGWVPSGNTPLPKINANQLLWRQMASLGQDGLNCFCGVNVIRDLREIDTTRNCYICYMQHLRMAGLGSMSLRILDGISTLSFSMVKFISAKRRCQERLSDIHVNHLGQNYVTVINWCMITKSLNLYWGHI